jgi:hypothetical protein
MQAADVFAFLGESMLRRLLDMAVHRDPNGVDTFWWQRFPLSATSYTRSRCSATSSGASGLLASDAHLLSH